MSAGAHSTSWSHGSRNEPALARPSSTWPTRATRSSAADEVGADLIVIGTHGRRGAVAVAARQRRRERRADARRVRSSSFAVEGRCAVKRILVALDSSPRAPLVLSAADRLAELTGATADRVPRVMRPAGHAAGACSPCPTCRLEDVLTRNAHGDLERLTRDIPPARDREADRRVRHAVGRHLPRRPRRGRGPDRDRLARLRRLDRVLGTTAGKVVNHADRNVLVVRATL